jgi:hypothetical protein
VAECIAGFNARPPSLFNKGYFVRVLAAGGNRDEPDMAGQLIDFCPDANVHPQNQFGGRTVRP